MRSTRQSTASGWPITRPSKNRAHRVDVERLARVEQRASGSPVASLERRDHVSASPRLAHSARDAVAARARAAAAGCRARRSPAGSASARSSASASVSSSTSTCRSVRPAARDLERVSLGHRRRAGSPRTASTTRGRLDQLARRRGVDLADHGRLAGLDLTAAARRAGHADSAGAAPTRAPPRSSGRARRSSARHLPDDLLDAPLEHPDVDLAGVHVGGARRNANHGRSWSRRNASTISVVLPRPARRRGAPTVAGAPSGPRRRRRRRPHESRRRRVGMLVGTTTLPSSEELHVDRLALPLLERWRERMTRLIGGTLDQLADKRLQPGVQRRQVRRRNPITARDPSVEEVGDGLSRER